MMRTLAKRVFKNSRFERPLWEVYDWIRKRWQAKAIAPRGWYSVNPDEERLDEFQIFSEALGPGERAKLNGEYEEAVISELISRSQSDTVFWEVGGKYGYHSLQMAQLADTVVAFEADPEAAEKLREAAQRNGFENMQVVEGTVGKDIDLNEFQPPDILLMDIEGWEENVLKSVEVPLKAGATWIIEMHEEGVVPGKYADREVVENRFDEFGYTTQLLSTRKPGNYHLLVEPGT